MVIPFIIIIIIIIIVIIIQQGRPIILCELFSTETEIKLAAGYSLNEGTQATKTGSIASRREICLRLAMAWFPVI